MATLRAEIAILLVVCGAIFGAGSLGFLQLPELLVFDELNELVERGPNTSQVTLIWQTEAEIKTLGFPMSDQTLHAVLAALAGYGPRAIGVDIYRDRPHPPGADSLREFLLGQHNVVLVEKMANAGDDAVHAPEYLPFEQVGFADMPVDADGRVRRQLLMMWDAEDQAHFSLSLAMALQYLAVENESDDTGLITPAVQRPDDIALNGLWLPSLDNYFGGYSDLDAGGYQVMLNPRMRADEIPGYAISELLAGKVPREHVADRMVLVATASPSVKDQFVVSGGALVYGGQLHAFAADELVRSVRVGVEPMTDWPRWGSGGWLVVWAGLGVLLGNRIRNPIWVALTGLVVAAAHGGFGLMMLARGVWVPVVAPLLACLLAYGLTIAWKARMEHVERDMIMRLFGQFLSPKVADEIWRERDAFMDGHVPKPVRAQVTVMQADLAGFTSAAQHLDPGIVMQWIGQYMEQMAQVVEQFGGVISDFVGDGLMVNFGVPIVRREASEVAADARNAVLCGLEMGRRLDRLNMQWQDSDLPPGRMRIGLCSGEVVSGTYGSETHRKYATVGTVVNTAARLEAYDKDGFRAEKGAFRLLVDVSTWRLVKDEFQAQQYSPAELRGLEAPVEIYRIYGEEEHNGSA